MSCTSKPSPSIEKFTCNRQKYGLGSDIDKETVFDFAYLHDEETVSYIENHGRIMVILRGPPGTGKATLSEMIRECYPEAAFCCADKYFDSYFSSPVRSKEALKLSHVFCQKKAQEACDEGKPVIIVQNTHMRKWEMQPYLDLAAFHNYTVIMAITLYRFDVTPKALFANNTDGLNFLYLSRRLSQWVDVLPLFTGWFLSPTDAQFLRSEALKTLEVLLGDGKFNRVFDVYDSKGVANYFEARNTLACIAGFSNSDERMKSYYLSDNVQDSYGKCFKIKVIGYFISTTDIIGIVEVTDTIEPLIFHDNSLSNDIPSFNALSLSDNVCSKTVPLVQLDSSSPSYVTEEWKTDEDIIGHQTTFIQLAVSGGGTYDVEVLYEKFYASIKNAPNPISYIELDDGTPICRLPNDQWLVRIKQKIVLKSLFTGLYI